MKRAFLKLSQNIKVLKDLGETKQGADLNVSANPWGDALCLFPRESVQKYANPFVCPTNLSLAQSVLSITVSTKETLYSRILVFPNLVGGNHFI